MNPTNRTEFKDYCLRNLGHPVIEINVDDDQVEDRIDEALQYWRDYHFDGLQKVYYIKLIDQNDINQKFINMDPAVTKDANNQTVNIVGVTRIFPLQDSQATINMFDLRYQLRLHELYDFTSASYVNYTMTMQHLRSLELLFTGEVPIRYQRHMKRLFIDWAWGKEITAGAHVIVECYAIIDPDIYNSIWNDMWLKKYATALVKRNWGSNLKKFAGVQLPGGVTLNGDKIYEEGNAEVKELEEKMINDFSLPVEWYMG